MTDPRPNFFIVGAPRCGTTSLWAYLRQHPDVFMSTPKEPHAFGRDLDSNGTGRFDRYRDRAAYLSLFAAGRGKARLGDASPYTLYSRTAAEEIHEFDPGAKILISLRHPADFAYSLYCKQIWNHNEDAPSFEAALELEEHRRAGRRLPPSCNNPIALRYAELAAFSTHVRRFVDAFGRANVKVVLFEELTADPAAVFGSVLDFLGLPSHHGIAFGAHNPGRVPRSVRLHRWIGSARRRGFESPALGFVVERVLFPLWAPLYQLNVWNNPPAPLSLRTRESLWARVEPDIAPLEESSGRDLSAWRRASGTLDASRDRRP